MCASGEGKWEAVNNWTKRETHLLSDYDVFLSPLSDFKHAIEEAGLGDKVVYLDRKDAYAFRVGE